jgi:hypothetical protein
MSITYRLAVSCGTIRVAARGSGTGLVRLWPVLVLIANWLAVSGGTIRVATRHRNHGWLGWRFGWAVFSMPPAEGLRILQASINLLTRPIEQPGCLAQRLLDGLSHSGLNLVQPLLLVVDRLLGLGQEAEHIIVGHSSGQLERLI